MMPRTKPNFEKFEVADLLKIAALSMLVVACFAAGVAAQQKGQKTFSSLEEASKTLVAAAKNIDEGAMLEILGPDAKQIISSGDATEDAESHTNFARKYEEMHRFVKEPDGSVVLYIGAENWPTPIPLGMKRNLWFFDTEAGKKESCSAELGATSTQPSGFPRSLWLGKKNTMRFSTMSTPRKSTVMKASTMAFIGRLRTVSPRARSSKPMKTRRRGSLTGSILASCR